MEKLLIQYSSGIQSYDSNTIDIDKDVSDNDASDDNGSDDNGSDDNGNDDNASDDNGSDDDCYSVLVPWAGRHEAHCLVS